MTPPTPWPPPPDRDSLRELLRDADIERLIAEEAAPPDEYDTEADAFHAAIAHLPTPRITPETLLPILQSLWSKNFAPTAPELAARTPALRALAVQVAHFFGPEAQPTVRS